MITLAGIVKVADDIRWREVFEYQNMEASCLVAVSSKEPINLASDIVMNGDQKKP